jgi:4-amino-4-deoxy-L-arabinose transferase-like glycosyltransferase
MHAPVQELRGYPFAPAVARSIDVFSLVAGVVLFVLSLVVALVVLRGFPNSADEHGYLFAAKTFLDGRLYYEAPPFDEFFGATYIFSIEGKLVSQYAPGWPAFLAVVKALGLPFLIAGPLVGAATVLATGALARAALDERAARIAVVLVATAPFFVFNAASFFNHVYAAFWLVLFVLAGRKLLDEPSRGAAVLLGVAIGMAGVTRYYSALLAALPFGIAFLAGARRGHWRLVPLAVLGAAPFAAGLLWYNYRITGDPFTTVTSWGLPFLKLGLWGYGVDGQHSPERALSWALCRVVELGEWTSPVFLVLWAIAFVVSLRNRTAQFHDFMLPVFIVGFLIYPDEGGNRYGPRYWFDAFPFMAVAVAGLLTDVGNRIAGRRRELLVHLTVVHLVVCAAMLPLISRFEYEVVAGRTDLYDAVDRAGLHNAIVLVRTGTSELLAMDPGDLTRNDPSLSQDVLYARDLGEETRKLDAAFPERTIWVYEREPTERYGRLTPWRG